MSMVALGGRPGASTARRAGIPLAVARPFFFRSGFQRRFGAAPILSFHRLLKPVHRKAAVRMLSEGLRQEVKPYGIRTTVISPGAIDTELPDSITEPDIAAAVREFYGIALPADSFANLLAYVIGAPEDVDINEVVFRPTRQEF
ncbi:SDR family oxidoreductase [Burkholderia gladioli]|uniref:SDR family oxidoreductase n=1 Tax=Burkholderia gladioli TaxID=28095 RepID=UPI0011B285D6|nr:SDR family NAD(P)-dependent oxidoreductase [Burkholderia gladioli]